MSSLKRVSFKVAKAIKEAGYPQHNLNEVTPLAYDDNGEIWEMGYFDQNPYLEYYSIVTYLEVWLWLCENGEPIDVTKYADKWKANCKGQYWIENTPEEAIIAAIEYLVENDLIKK